jgi:hypothetical protein
MTEIPMDDPNLIEIPPLALRDLLTIAAEALSTWNPATFVKLNKRCARELAIFLAFAAEFHPEAEIRRHAALETGRLEKQAEETR